MKHCDNDIRDDFTVEVYSESKMQEDFKRHPIAGTCFKDTIEDNEPLEYK